MSTANLYSRFSKMASLLLFVVLFGGANHSARMPIQGATNFPPRVQVFVFEPFTSVRPHSLRPFLARASRKVGFVIFPRYREFAKAVRDQNPDAILVRPGIAAHMEGYKTLLVASRDGQTEESLVFLSVDKKVNLEELPDSKIGVIDFLGKKETRDWLNDRLDVKSSEVRTVAKIEDLLTLLQFKYVDSVLVPRNYTLSMQHKTRLNLKETNPGALKIGLPVLAVKDDPDRIKVIREAVLSMDVETTEALGLDKWLPAS